MARSRNLKPGFFKNELLAELDPIFRLVFIGLWTVADREGRLEYRPKRIKAEVAPYDEVDIAEAVASLIDRGFLLPYESNGIQLIQIVNWSKHQNPHHKETASTFPPPSGYSNKVCDGYIPLSNTIRNRIYARDGRICKQCGAVHGLSIDHIKPVSKGGNSTDDNLQVLCMGCNFSKGNRILSMNHGQTMDESCMVHGQTMKNSSCPTDSLNPITLTLNPITTSLPLGLSLETWLAFKENRKALKARLTKHAENLILAKLTKLNADGEDIELAVKTSIENGWKGVFSIRGSKYDRHQRIDNSVPARIERAYAERDRLKVIG